MSEYRSTSLWKEAFLERDDDLEDARNRLRTAYLSFRDRVALLVSQIHKDMPELTVHDIAHIDALWRTASEIAGPGYQINPAEGFVLGGAFLLHDAAHCIAAYPGGVAELQKLSLWKEIKKIKYGSRDVEPGTTEFQVLLFEVLRNLHPTQARRLPKISWSVAGDETPLFLIQDDDLRESYGDVIGVIAESHWWSPHEIESLSDQILNAPACIHPASWSIDVLKLAVLLRTADAAHLDAQRAPRFLSALTSPTGISLDHWKFQARLHQVSLESDLSRHELRITGTGFPSAEQKAWWLAYDSAKLVDKKLISSDRILSEHKRARLAARSVSVSRDPVVFSRAVPTIGWVAVDTSIHITDIKSLVERFGGEKLYGNNPSLALREVLQNSVDAIHAARELGALDQVEGYIEVAAEKSEGGYWLHVSDTGIGMSRYVLIDVLLDFGRTLWRSGDVRGEWQGLLNTPFKSVGKFGIGFFSVFMLGDRVVVNTRRFERKDGEPGQWVLEFNHGIGERPVLRQPEQGEELRRHGTKVSIHISDKRWSELLAAEHYKGHCLELAQLCAKLVPAIDIDMYIATQSVRKKVVSANDWVTLSPAELHGRVYPCPNDVERARLFVNEWQYLQDVTDEGGRIIGRCAVSETSYFGARAIGVVNGIYAGTVDGLDGVVFVRDQDDLARRDAVPDMSSTALQAWAEEHKNILMSCNGLTSMRSARLALLGASENGLVLGSLGGRYVTYEELVDLLAEHDEILLHEDEVEHEYDDDVLPKDFEFTPLENLLEYERVGGMKWVSDINGGIGSSNDFSIFDFIESAINESWGSAESDVDTYKVGNSSFVPIERECIRVIRTKVGA